MAINKVEYDGRTLMDLTSDTVSPETLLEGITAHNKAGEQIVGTAKSGGGAGPFEKVEILEWTPATNTKEYRLPRNELKYCIIADKSVNDRPNSAVISILVTDSEFFSSYKPIAELSTTFQGNLEQSMNYYGMYYTASIVSAKSNFVAGRTYDVILVY